MKNKLDTANKISGSIDVSPSTSTATYIQEQTTTKNKDYNLDMKSPTVNLKDCSNITINFCANHNENIN